MAHRGWWPTVPHSLTDAKVQSITHSEVKPALHKSAKASSTPIAAAPVCEPSKHLCQVLPPSSPDAIPSPAEALGEDLDWQTDLLQKVLLRPKSADAIQATPAAPLPTEQNSSDLPSQKRSSPESLLEKQLGSLGAPLPQKHSSTIAEAQSHALHYAAVFLDRLSVAKLLAWTAPHMHSCLTADHMTLLFRPSFAAAEQLPLGTSVELSVTAKMHNSTAQAVSVHCPSWTHKLLQAPAHITISVARGTRAKQAGDLVRKVQQGHRFGIVHDPCEHDLRLTGHVGVMMDGGSQAFDLRALHAAKHGAAVNSNHSFDEDSGPPSALTFVQTTAGKAPPSTASPSTDGALSAATNLAARPRVSAPVIASPVVSISRLSSGATCVPFTGAANAADSEQLSFLLAADAVSQTQAKPGNQRCSVPLTSNRALQSQQSPTLGTSALAPQSADRAQHAQRATGAYHSVSDHRPRVQQRISPGAQEDVDDDDVSEAFEQLDALTAPVEISRQSMPQHSRPQHQSPSVRSVASTSPAAAARTSASAGHLISTQSASSSRENHFVRNGAHSSTRPEASHRRLWVPPSEEASTNVAATPVKIMKRPSPTSNQYAHASASDSLAAGNSAPTSAIQPSLKTPNNKALMRLSAQQQASDAASARNVAPEVCPVGSQSPVNDVMMESKVSHLMARVAGLSPASAFLALQAARGNLQQALLVIHKHAELLLQAASATAPQSHSVLNSSPVLCNSPAVGHLSSALYTQSRLANEQYTPSRTTSVPQSTVNWEREPSALQPSPVQTFATTADSSSASQSLQASNTAVPDVTALHPMQIPSASNSMSSSLPPTDAKQLLPADAMLPVLAQHVMLPVLARDSRHANAAQLLPADAVLPDTVQHARNTTTLTSVQTDKLGVCPSQTADSSRAVHSSTGSDESINASVDQLIMHDTVPENVEAALAAASKVLEERGKIRGVADQERQALTLHTQARDVYFEAAQKAYERGDKEAAQELAGKGKEHAQLAKEARTKANQAAYDSSNLSVANRFKVDLHGMHVEEALNVLENHLLNLGGLGCPNGVLLQVITGIGKHSMNGRPKILPAVVRYLSDAGYRFLEAKGNPGVLDVTIGGRRATAF